MLSAEKKRVLVIEDESHISEGLKLNLSIQGYDVKIAPDGQAGIQLWHSWQPDLIVLDVMLPIIDGFAVLRTIRKKDEKLPVLILSAKSSVEDKVYGLRCGVDDYLAKPFDLDEFMLRVQRLITRTSWYASTSLYSQNLGFSSQNSQLPSQNLELSSQTLELSSRQNLELPSQKLSSKPSGKSEFNFGANHIDFITGKASCQLGNIVLTEQEIKLIRILIANRGRPVTRQKLLEAGWGYSGAITTRTLDNFMVRLRRYFEKNPKKPAYFKSRRSVGYIFDY